MNMTARLQRTIAFPVLMMATIVLIAYEAITKGWLMFYVIPLFVIAVPVLLLVQVWNRRVQRRESKPFIARVVRWQLISLIALYIFIPGVGDTDELYMFGITTLHQSSPIVLVSALLAAAASIIFAVTTVQAIILLTRARRVPKALP